MPGFVSKHRENKQEQSHKGPVEVARLHKPVGEDLLKREAARYSDAGKPEATELVLARNLNQLDKNALISAREHGLSKAGSIMGTLDQRINRDRNQEDPTIIGLEFRFSWGDPSGTKFNANVSGVVGTGVSTVINTARAVTNGTKAGEFLAKIDPEQRLNDSIASKTGWEHDSNINTKSQREIDLTKALERAEKYEKWSVAARKENFPGFDKSASQAENATRYVVSLLQPSFDAFKKEHPRISDKDLKSIRADAIESVLQDKPYSDSGFTSGFKRLFRRAPATGLLENGKLSAESKKSVEDSMKENYSDMLENRGGK